MTSSTPTVQAIAARVAEQRRRHAERKPGQMPERLQHRRTYPARPRQILELGQVPLFLLGHPADLVARAAAAGDGKLAVINPHGAIFAGVIDADECARPRLRAADRRAGRAGGSCLFPGYPAGEVTR